MLPRPLERPARSTTVRASDPSAADGHIASVSTSSATSPGARNNPVHARGHRTAFFRRRRRRNRGRRSRRCERCRERGGGGPLEEVVGYPVMSVEQRLDLASQVGVLAAGLGDDETSARALAAEGGLKG